MDILAKIPIALFPRPCHYVPPFGGLGYGGEIEIRVHPAKIKSGSIQRTEQLFLVKTPLGLLLVGADVDTLLVFGKEGQIELAEPRGGIILVLPAAEYRAPILVLILQSIRIVSVFRAVADCTRRIKRRFSE